MVCRRPGRVCGKRTFPRHGRSPRDRDALQFGAATGRVQNGRPAISVQSDTFGALAGGACRSRFGRVRRRGRGSRDGGGGGGRAVPDPGASAALRGRGERSGTVLPEGQQAHEERVGLGRIAHFAPVHEDEVGGADEVQGLAAREPPPRVVVRVVAVLLQVDEGRGGADEPVLERQAFEARAQPGRRIALGELAGDAPHGGGVEAGGGRRTASGVDEEMEHGVVGGRHAAPQAGLPREAPVPGREAPGLGEEIDRQAHAAASVSSSRTRT